MYTVKQVVKYCKLIQYKRKKMRDFTLGAHVLLLQAVKCCKMMQYKRKKMRIFTLGAHVLFLEALQ
jgi:hypothetical protein